MRLAILGSGSKGNSIFLETDNIKLLIDAGFSGKKTEIQLKNIGVNISEIDGILITHEHGDHILGAGIVSRK
ncbi:MAG: MBL fold metallo-hydrolase, partial [Cetobacterium sp.]